MPNLMMQLRCGDVQSRHAVSVARFASSFLFPSSHRIARIPRLCYVAVAVPLAVEAALAVAMKMAVSDSAVIAVVVIVPAISLAVAILAVARAAQANTDQ